MTFKRFASSILVLTLFTACQSGPSGGSSGSSTGTVTLTPNPYGVFSSDQCFYHKLASEGMGIPIYEQSSIQLNADGSGKTTYILAMDAKCTTPIMSGEETLTYVRVPAANGVTLIQIDQMNSGNMTRVWVPAYLTDQGYYFDIDFSDGNSGPYLSNPSEAELSEFASNPVAKGLFFKRQ